MDFDLNCNDQMIQNMRQNALKTAYDRWIWGDILDGMLY